MTKSKDANGLQNSPGKRRSPAEPKGKSDPGAHEKENKASVEAASNVTANGERTQNVSWPELVRSWLPIALSSASALISGTALTISLKTAGNSTMRFAIDGMREVHVSEEKMRASKTRDFEAESMAKVYFKMALELDSENPVALAGLALLNHRDGNPIVADELIHKAQQASPEHPLALVVGGAIFAEKAIAAQANSEIGTANELAAKAHNKFNEAEKISPKNPTAYVNSGSLYLQTGQIEEASKEFERANINEPGNLESLIQRAQIFHHAGVLDRAIEILKEAERHASGDSHELGKIHYLLATIYYQKDDGNAALDYWTLSVKEHPAFLLENTAIPLASPVELSLDNSNSLVIKSANSTAIKKSEELAFPTQSPPEFVSGKGLEDRWNFLV